MDETTRKIADQERERFDNFLCNRMDAVDNACKDFITELRQCDPDWWSMEQIGLVGEMAVTILNTVGCDCCYPYNEIDDDGYEIPCFLKNECEQLRHGHCSYIDSIGGFVIHQINKHDKEYEDVRNERSNCIRDNG